MSGLTARIDKWQEKGARSIRRKRRKRRNRQKVIKNISKEALSNKKHNQQFQKTHRNKIALDSTKLAISVVCSFSNWPYSSERKPGDAGNSINPLTL